MRVVGGREGVIGRGALGEVRRGIYRDSEVALKRLHLLRTDAAWVAEGGVRLEPAERAHVLRSFIKECELLSTLSHPHIVLFVGIVVDATPRAEPLFLALQYIRSGSLEGLLYEERHAALRSDEGGRLPLRTQLVLHVGVFRALAHLAALNVLHRDVKPANILVVVEGGRLAKSLLADFGEAKEIKRTLTARGTMAGTPVYMAPEMKEADDLKGPKADVFSAGVVMAEVSSGQAPRPGPREVRRGARGRREVVPEDERRADDIGAMRNPELEPIVRLCVVDFDEERADAAAVLVELEGLQARQRGGEDEGGGEGEGEPRTMPGQLLR